jgi:hypothetical protein
MFIRHLDSVTDVGWDWKAPRVYRVTSRALGNTVEFRLRWAGHLSLGRLGCVGSYVDVNENGNGWEYLGTLTNAEPARGWAFHVGRKSTASDRAKEAARWFFAKVLDRRDVQVLRLATVELL